MSNSVRLTLEEYMACVYKVFGAHTLPDIIAHYTEAPPAHSLDYCLRMRRHTKSLRTAIEAMLNCNIVTAHEPPFKSSECDSKTVIISEGASAVSSEHGVAVYRLTGKKPNRPPLKTDHLSEHEQSLLLLATQEASRKQDGERDLHRYLRNVSKRRAKKNIQCVNRYLSSYRAVLKLTNNATFGRGFISTVMYICRNREIIPVRVPLQ